MTRSMLMAGSIFAALTLGSVSAGADSPREFLTQAQQGANAEIMLGRLAIERGRSPAVRDFGQTLVDDHRQARQEVRDLGRRFGVRPTRDVTPEARADYERLASMGGRRFDREFVLHMIDDHRKDIAEFRDEAREGHGAVSDLAQRQLPTLRKHLDMALALDNRGGRFSGSYDQVQDRNHDRSDWRGRNYDNAYRSER